MKEPSPHSIQRIHEGRHPNVGELLRLQRKQLDFMERFYSTHEIRDRFGTKDIEKRVPSSARNGHLPIDVHEDFR